MMNPAEKPQHPHPAVPFWFTLAHKPVPQDFPMGYRITMGVHTGELVGTYASHTERYYRFHFKADTSQRIISQTRLHLLVKKLSVSAPKLLPAGRTRGNHKQVETPDVIYLPARMEKAAG